MEALNKNFLFTLFLFLLFLYKFLNNNNHNNNNQNELIKDKKNDLIFIDAFNETYLTLFERLIKSKFYDKIIMNDKNEDVRYLIKYSKFLEGLRLSYGYIEDQSRIEHTKMNEIFASYFHYYLTMNAHPKMKKIYSAKDSLSLMLFMEQFKLNAKFIYLMSKNDSDEHLIKWTENLRSQFMIVVYYEDLIQDKLLELFKIEKLFSF